MHTKATSSTNWQTGFAFLSTPMHSSSLPHFLALINRSNSAMWDELGSRYNSYKTNPICYFNCNPITFQICFVTCICASKQEKSGWQKEDKGNAPNS